MNDTAIVAACLDSQAEVMDLRDAVARLKAEAIDARRGALLQINRMLIEDAERAKTRMSAYPDNSKDRWVWYGHAMALAGAASRLERLASQ